VATPPQASSNSAAGSKSNGSDAPRLSESKLKSSFVSALDEYLNQGNVREFCEEISSLCGRFDKQRAKTMFLSMIVDRVIEKKDQERQSMIQLMEPLFQHHVVEPSDFVAALSDVFELYQEIVIDSPKAGTYLTQLIGHCLNRTLITSAQVNEAMKKLREDNASVADDFMQELNQLTGTAAVNAGESRESIRLPEWTKTFSQMVRDKVPENEVVEFLAKSPQDEVAKFGPDVVDVVFEHAARRAGALQDPAQEEKMVVLSSANVLKRLLQNGQKQATQQARALQTISSTVRRCQASPGFLSRVFKELHDQGIVLEEAFMQWSQGADPEDVKEASDFMKWLAEAPTEAEDS